jgi:hypothetical protein
MDCGEYFQCEWSESIAAEFCCRHDALTVAERALGSYRQASIKLLRLWHDGRTSAGTGSLHRYTAATCSHDARSDLEKY